MRAPILYPCTYWAPMPIRRPECGWNPNKVSKLVNYRPSHFKPGNCPCVWPCTRHFDPIQRCRLTNKETLEPDLIHSNGEPWSGSDIIIQDILVAQLCRAMKLSMTVDKTIHIGWTPIRVDLNPISLNNRKRRSIKIEPLRKRKREQVMALPEPDYLYEDPEVEFQDVEQDDDRFLVYATYNLDRNAHQNGTSDNETTKKQCAAWKYRSCPRHSDESQEEMEISAQTLKSKMRIPEYMSRLFLNKNSNGNTYVFKNTKRFTRQAPLSEEDEDDILFEKAQGQYNLCFGTAFAFKITAKYDLIVIRLWRLD